MYDLDEIRHKVSLVAMAEEAGARFQSAHKLKSCCPMPKHAGDRDNPTAFQIYDGGMKWKCFTSCPEGANGGDVIAFYMALKEVDFKTAIKDLAELADVASENPKTPQKLASCQSPVKPAPTGPTPAWQERARQFITWAQQNLNSSKGQKVCEYLETERGLWPETWQHFGLGYNPSNLYDDPARWELAGNKIWLPRGVVIPGMWKGAPWYIKIRRPRLDDLLGKYIGGWAEKDGLPKLKFGGPRGGQLALFGLEQSYVSPALLLVEGEWDVMLTWQWCQDLCNVSTLGGAQSHLDMLDLLTLARYPAVIVVYDDDNAGNRGREYIAKIRGFTQRVRIVDPPAHDLTDFWKGGGNLRAWVAGHVAEAMEDALAQVDPRQSNPTIERWQRIADLARQETCFRLP